MTIGEWWRYWDILGKSLLLDNINEVIEKNTKGVNSVIDIFAGSGVVSKTLKKKDTKYMQMISCIFHMWY